MDKIRGFEVVRPAFMCWPEVETILPRRGTKQSAGYDFFSKEDAVIMPGQVYEFPMDVKAYMQSDEVLKLYPRSSIGIRMNCMIANTVPIIDADFYGNATNDGNITIFLRNISKHPVTINRGDRIAQGIFEKYLIADNDPDDLPERAGGLGSTGK